MVYSFVTLRRNKLASLPGLLLATYIHDETRLAEDHSLRPVGGDVTVELLPVPVPLHAVQRVALQVVGTLQGYIRPLYTMGRNGLLGQSDPPTS